MAVPPVYRRRPRLGGASLIGKNRGVVFKTGDAGQRFDAQTFGFQGLPAALEGLFDDNADAGDGTARLGGDLG